MNTALFVAALAIPLPTVDVLVVDSESGPGSTHVDLQAAVDAAVDGDTLLVRRGDYSSFSVDGKGLVIVADAAGFSKVSGSIAVSNVPAGSEFVLRGFENDPGVNDQNALRVDDCAGSVWIEKCNLESSNGLDASAARVFNSSDVSFARCGLIGGHGGGGSFGAGNSGGSGIYADRSSVAVYDCIAVGGDGQYADDLGGQGGSGVYLIHESRLFASGCVFDAGDGGGADDDLDFFTGEIVCGICGNGGSGVLVEFGFGQPSSALLVDNLSFPGVGGFTTSIKGCSDGGPGADVSGDLSSVTTLAGNAREFRVGSPRREGESTTLGFGAESGDFAFALISGGSELQAFPQFFGALLLTQPLTVLAAGSVPSSGLLQSTVPIPDFPDAATLAATLYAQSLFVTPTAEIRLGPQSQLTILDASL